MKLTEKAVNWSLAAVVVGLIVVGVFSFDKTRYQVKWQQIRGNFQALSEAYGSLLESSPTPKASIIPSPTPYVYHEPSEEQKKYMIALGGIIAYQNNENIDQLKSNFNVAELKKLMKSSWSIEDRTTALATLDWLKTAGHREEYNGLVNIVLRNNIRNCEQLRKSGYSIAFEETAPCQDKEVKFTYDFISNLNTKLNGKTLYAWDYGRLVNVARWSYTLGYITEEEAWKYIVPAAQRIQKEYGSWSEYGEHYLLGRGYWMQDMNASEAQELILKRLINPQYKSAWTTLDWYTLLN